MREIREAHAQHSSCHCSLGIWLFFIVWFLLLTSPAPARADSPYTSLAHLTCADLRTLLVEVVDSHVLLGDLYKTNRVVKIWQELRELADGGNRVEGPAPSSRQEQVSREQWLQAIEGISANDCHAVRKLTKSLPELNRRDRLGEFLNRFLLQLDPHSGFLTAAEAKAYLNGFSTGYVGIGVYLEEIRGKILIRKIFPHGAAALSGRIQVGSELIKVNGATVSEDCRTACLVEQLLGLEGTPVTLTIKQEGREYVLQLVRKSVQVRDLSLEVEVENEGDGKTARIHLSQFYRNAGLDLQDLLTSLMSPDDQGRSLQSVVLDLRGNAGGELTAMADVAANFLESRVMAKVVGRDGVIGYRGQAFNTIYRGPLTVLVDSQTKSAAEILAGSLQTLKRATVVGDNGTTRTYGKGSLYSWHTIEMSDEDTGQLTLKGLIRITTHLMYLPSGESPQGRGIKPDILRPGPDPDPDPDPEAVLDHEEDLPAALTPPVAIAPFALTSG